MSDPEGLYACMGMFILAFELTIWLELGMSPIGVGLHDPWVTCFPLVIVLPLQNAMKLEGNEHGQRQTKRRALRVERVGLKDSLLIVRGCAIALASSCALAIDALDDRLVQCRTTSGTSLSQDHLRHVL
jgi:hypothetical protein